MKGVLAVFHRRDEERECAKAASLQEHHHGIQYPFPEIKIKATAIQF